jgi:Uma2 family endonuclease
LTGLERSIQPFCPILVIEVTSPSNTFHELARKIERYLKGGTKTVWLFETASREVHIYSRGYRTRVLAADGVLEDAGLLPGFSVRVADLFHV